MNCIYLDHNATTPVDPRVLEAMLPYLQGKFGNSSSVSHPYGWEAKEAVEVARGQVAALFGVAPREMVFTSGATESNNLVLLGSAAWYEKRGGERPHVITQATEHPAVLEPVEELAKRGFGVDVLPVDRFGRVDPEQVRSKIRKETCLVSIMAANNEIGTLQPLEEIGAICRERGVLLHTDAAQAAGKIPLPVREWGIHYLSLSGHKFYAPKGVGALYVGHRDAASRIERLVFGGSQERKIRPGTLNVPGIVALGEACRLAAAELDEERVRLRRFRDELQESLAGQLDGVHVNGHPEHRLSGTLNVSFEGVDGSALLVKLPGVAVSSGSACASGSTEPSHVLKAIGVSGELAVQSLRFGLGRFTTVEEVRTAAAQVSEVVKQLREENRFLAHSRRSR